MAPSIPFIPKDTSNGFTLQVTAEIQPGKADEWLSVFQETRRLVAAEPGCVLFEVFRGTENPNKFTWIETWTISVETFVQHQMTKPYMVPYEEKTAPLLVGEKQALIWERV